MCIVGVLRAPEPTCKPQIEWKPLSSQGLLQHAPLPLHLQFQHLCLLHTLGQNPSCVGAVLGTAAWHSFTPSFCAPPGASQLLQISPCCNSPQWADNNCWRTVAFWPHPLHQELGRGGLRLVISALHYIGILLCWLQSPKQLSGEKEGGGGKIWLFSSMYIPPGP